MRPVLPLVLLALLAGCSDEPSKEPRGGAGGDAGSGGAGGTGGQGGTGGSGGNGGTPCTTLDCFQVDCLAGTTSLTGVVHAPEGTLPLPNVTVYVPLTAPAELGEGPECAPCSGDGPPGALVWTVTDADGRFELDDVPATSNVPLVIETGRWRRETTVAVVPECTSTALADDALRLPRDHTEGHMPRIALTTGGGDALECVLRKLGVDGEVGASGDARIHFYAGDKGSSRLDDAHGGTEFSPASTFWSDAANLEAYDLVLLACEADQITSTKPAAARAAMKDYADGGGRILASHWQNYWFEAGPDPWPSLLTFERLADLGDLLFAIDVSTPRAATFATWLAHLGTAPEGSAFVAGAQHTLVDLDEAKVQQWIHADTTANGRPSIQLATFSTPAGKPACGRVAFTDMHASAADDPGAPFPAGCVSSVTAFSDSELVFAYMLFDLGACVP